MNNEIGSINNSDIKNKNIHSIKYKSSENRWVQGVSIMLWFLGIINILSAWFSYDPFRSKIINEIFEFQLITGSRYLVIITGIIALLVSPALYRGKRVAWFVAVFILGVSGFAHIIKDADIEEACVCILLLGILLPLYKYCPIKSDPVRLRQGWKFLLTTLLFVIAYTFIGLHVFSSSLGTETDNLSLLKFGVNALLFDTSSLVPKSIGARFFMDSLLWINGFSLIFGTFISLSPVIARQLQETNIEISKKTIDKYAVQPVQHFISTREYQHFILSNNTNQGFIGYQVANNVAVAIGNPCGNMSLINITKNWIDYTMGHDWIPAVYQATDDYVPVLKELGFDIIPIGVEAMVNLEKFSLQGKAMQDIRSSINKSKRNDWIIRDYTEDDWLKVKKLNQNWLKIHGIQEIGFAMGKAAPKYLKETRSVLLLDKDENLLAYINNVELPGINGRAVDLMRREIDAPAGVMEALLAHEILQAQKEKKSCYDLGFSPLAKISENYADNTAAVKILKLIYNHQKRYYDFQGLHQFKAKFMPEWHASVLAYPGAINLPKVLFALLRLNKSSNKNN